MPTAQKKTEPILLEYVVVADAINVTSGKKLDGRPQVTRLLHGSLIKAPEGHEHLAEHLAMGTVVLKDDMKATMSALAKRGGPHKPTAVRTEDGSPRITAAGLHLIMTGDEPVEVQESVAPLSAPDPEPAPE